MFIEKVIESHIGSDLLSLEKTMKFKISYSFFIKYYISEPKVDKSSLRRIENIVNRKSVLMLSIRKLFPSNHAQTPIFLFPLRSGSTSRHHRNHRQLSVPVVTLGCEWGHTRGTLSKVLQTGQPLSPQGTATFLGFVVVDPQ